MNYLAFILSNPRFLAYGFMMLFFSGFGQTYYFGPYTADVREAFGLSHGEIGLQFSLATGLASLLMMWAGRKIDDVDLRLFTFMICVALIAGCFTMSGAHSMPTLILAFFLLRLSGQGLMVHASFTSMARYFDKERGKAISIAAFGMTASQAVFPFLGETLNRAFGWRDAWYWSAIFLTLTLIPMMLWLLTGHKERHEAFLRDTEEGQAGSKSGWTRRVLLRDPRFYLMIPSSLAMPYILTGFIFHQQYIARLQGWAGDLQPKAFVAFAASGFVCSVIAGPLIDRLGARRLIAWNLLPFLAGMLCLAVIDHPAAAWLYLGLSGITLGFGIAVGTAFWSELHGPRHVGSVRAIMGSLGMLATAASPYTMGVLLDQGVTVHALGLGSAAYLGVGSVLVWLAVTRYWEQPHLTAEGAA
ncbi:MAG: MFS transporter [Alphaproteobacteria bacterium]|nr:MFS transporter [Alphaproteobacteria bacterium]